MPYHTPRQKPSSGHSRTASSAAPASSNTSVPSSTRFISRTMPPSCSALTASEMYIRCCRLMRLPVASENSTAMDMNPRPPT